LSEARIGKITYKKSGLSVVIPAFGDRTDFMRDMHRNLDQINENLDDLSGLIIVGWDSKGYFSRATRILPESPIGPTLLPSWLAEVLRRDIAAAEAHDAIDERLL
jgi:hypothetical protein